MNFTWRFEPAQGMLGFVVGPIMMVGMRSIPLRSFAVQNENPSREFWPQPVLRMQSMYQRLHVDAHLKHNGRLQLGLFLKVWPSQ